MPHILRILFLGARSVVFLLPWLAHLFVADILLSCLLPLGLVVPTLVYDISSLIAWSVWQGIQALFSRTNGAEILVTGDELPAGESAVVVSNHVEWTDFYMIQELAVRAGMLGRCRWFAKRQLKWVPFLGWGLWAMGMPLVSRQWTQDRKEMERVFGGVVKKKWPIWLIAYSEATRFTPSKRSEAVTWASKRNKRVPPHLLFPRTKGFVASVQQLRRAPHVKAVYDVTVAYAEKTRENIPSGEEGWKFQSPPSFTQTITLPWLNERWQFLVHARRFPLDELPEGEVELAVWLEERWMEKGELLEGLKQKLDSEEGWEGMGKKRM